MAYKMKGSPFQRNFGIGRTEAPEKESPLNRKSYEERQRIKAEKLYTKAEKREARTAEGSAAFAEAGSKWAGLEPIFGTGKYARRRAEKAELKAAAGSRKAYRNVKSFLQKGNIKAEVFGNRF